MALCTEAIALAAEARLAVVATLSKGYDLDYIWKQVDPSLAKDPAGYYIQASETGGEPPSRWWGPATTALGLEPGQLVERERYGLLFGERKDPDGTPPGDGRKAADMSSPSSPWRRYRFTHFDAVAREMPISTAMRATGASAASLGEPVSSFSGERGLAMSHACERFRMEGGVTRWLPGALVEPAGRCGARRGGSPQGRVRAGRGGRATDAAR
jgi:hypothetical protein